MKKYVLFEIAGSTFGIVSDDVRHVEMVEHVTIVPNANPAIDGVVFSRGEVIPALNLRTRFGYPRVAYDTRTRLLFVQLGGRVIGLIVDSAREFVGISDEMMRPIGESLTGIDGNFLKAVAQVGSRLVLLVDLAVVLDVEKFQPAPSSPPVSESAAVTQT